jgi:ribose-phosphate pyrophosphokinase
MKSYHDLQVFSGNANPSLAQKMCEYLEIPMGDAYVGRFPDGEIDIKIRDDVRGSDVYVVQTTSTPVNDHVMELLLLIDTLKRASAERITAVIPYYGYARKDRKDEGRVPISAKLIADLITTAGADRVLTIDLHAAQIQGFFNVPVDHLFALPVFLKHFREMNIENVCVVAPDVGSIRLNRSLAKKLNCDLVIVDKRRHSGTETEVVNLIGDVRGKNAIICDDMISTGTSAVNATVAVRDRGAEHVYLCATHAVLCGNAVENLNGASALDRILITDTIPLNGKQIDRLEVCSIAPLLGEAVRRIHRSESVSCLFEADYRTLR